MKEKVTIYTQYGKLIESTRIVYDFSGRKLWIDYLFEILVWGGLLAFCLFILALFI